MKCAAKEAENSPRQSELKIRFPWGIPGLEYDEYILHGLGRDSPFYFLRSVEEPRVGLLLINPFAAYGDYEFDLDDGTAARLEIENERQVAVLCTVNTSRGKDRATVNLLAPIVINTEKMLAKQVVLNDGRYSLRTPLMVKAAEKEGR
jgi:flagellar assembly factor FliW